METTAIGSIAPTGKLAADAHAARVGRAAVVSLNPDSSWGCAPGTHGTAICRPAVGPDPGRHRHPPARIARPTCAASTRRAPAHVGVLGVRPGMHGSEFTRHPRRGTRAQPEDTVNRIVRCPVPAAATPRTRLAVDPDAVAMAVLGLRVRTRRVRGRCQCRNGQCAQVTESPGSADFMSDCRTVMSASMSALELAAPAVISRPATVASPLAIRWSAARTNPWLLAVSVTWVNRGRPLARVLSRAWQHPLEPVILDLQDQARHIMAAGAFAVAEKAASADNHA